MLNFVADESADLIVMGAYGHSRLREVILGGMTRDLLTHMTIPVFMSH
ncbi:MAG: universal stress protein [Alphaproteobacteria bacterium]